MDFGFSVDAGQATVLSALFVFLDLDDIGLLVHARHDETDKPDCKHHSNGNSSPEDDSPYPGSKAEPQQSIPAAAVSYAGVPRFCSDF